jgi:hypothetical protein
MGTRQQPFRQDFCCKRASKLFLTGARRDHAADCLPERLDCCIETQLSFSEEQRHRFGIPGRKTRCAPGLLVVLDDFFLQSPNNYVRNTIPLVRFKFGGLREADRIKLFKKS